MVNFIQNETSVVGPIIFIWFLVALVICVAMLFKSRRFQDVEQRKAAQRKAWRILLYPILFQIVFIILSSLLVVVASGS